MVDRIVWDKFVSNFEHEVSSDLWRIQNSCFTLINRDVDSINDNYYGLIGAPDMCGDEDEE